MKAQLQCNGADACLWLLWNARPPMAVMDPKPAFNMHLNLQNFPETPLSETQPTASRASSAVLKERALYQNAVPTKRVTLRDLGRCNKYFQVEAMSSAYYALCSGGHCSDIGTQKGTRDAACRHGMSNGHVRLYARRQSNSVTNAALCA